MTRTASNRVAQWFCRRVGDARDCGTCIHNPATHPDGASPDLGEQNPVLRERGGCMDYQWREARK